MKNWVLADRPKETFVAEIARRFHLSLEVATIVALRTSSITEAEQWLRPEQAPLSNPFDLPEMDRAVARILAALKANEPITVYGDYDTDGITATALMVKGLQALGATCVKPFFPDRETEGYGLSKAAIQRCLTACGHTSTLFITVDCGITSVEEVDDLTTRGIEVIVTDHHTLPEVLPAAVANINPRRLPSDHPAAGLCGCATAFMVLMALAHHCQEFDPLAYCDLVAVASIADVMELKGDNRSLVARGLQHLASISANRGLSALASLQKVLPERPTAERVAFSLVPCINAAGRLGKEKLKIAYALLGLERSEYASTLKQINEDRREIERALYERILATDPQPSPYGHVAIVGGEGFHPGVIGIVAARLMERMGVPVAIVCRTPDGGGHGSMRSCGNWNAVHALDQVKTLLDHYGGHAQAAGFSLKPGTYEAFVERFPQAFSAPYTEPVSLYDSDLSNLPITLELCRELDILEPFGNGNPKPIFRKGFTLMGMRPCGETRTHLILDLAPDDQGPTLRAIWFGGAEKAQHWSVGRSLQAFFTLGVDTYRLPAPKLSILDAELC